MKVLWVRPFFPHPANAGNHILSLQVLRRLHKLHEIHFVAHYLPESKAIEEAGTVEFCSQYSAVDPPVHKPHWRPYKAQLLREFLFGRGDQVSPQMRKRVAELVRSGTFDAVVSDSVFVSSAIPPDCPYMLLAHNVETVVNERHASVQKSAALRWHHAIYARNVCKLETVAFRKAARIVALSENDRGIMRDRFGRNDVRIMSFGADIEYFDPPARPSEGPRHDLVFLGSMDCDANIDGVHWFCSEVLPLIRRARPETTLAVVGRTPDESIRALGSDPAITVSGTVPDVRPWLWGAKAFIVPLRVGGGIRIKIYEGMAAQMPIVSTSIGAEGLRISPEHDILMGDTADEFARQTLRLLDDARLRGEIGSAAREMVTRNFSWDRAAQDIDSVLQEVAIAE